MFHLCLCCNLTPSYRRKCFTLQFLNHHGVLLAWHWKLESLTPLFQLRNRVQVAITHWFILRILIFLGYRVWIVTVNLLFVKLFFFLYLQGRQWFAGGNVEIPLFMAGPSFQFWSTSLRISLFFIWWSFVTIFSRVMVYLWLMIAIVWLSWASLGDLSRSRDYHDELIPTL